MDITSALAASGPTERVGRCLLQKRLDAIPEGTDGRGDLLNAVASPDWTAPMLVRVFLSLGLSVSASVIRQHRAGTCACSNGG